MLGDGKVRNKGLSLDYEEEFRSYMSYGLLYL